MPVGGSQSISNLRQQEPIATIFHNPTTQAIVAYQILHGNQTWPGKNFRARGQDGKATKIKIFARRKTITHAEIVWPIWMKISGIKCYGLTTSKPVKEAGLISSSDDMPFIEAFSSCMCFVPCVMERQT